MYSIQTAVSNGHLVLLPLSIEYDSRDLIHVYFDGVEDARQWAWVGTTDKAISFTPEVEAGVVVRVQRITPLDTVPNIFGAATPPYVGNAEFDADTVDENFRQTLRVAQESTDRTDEAIQASDTATGTANAALQSAAQANDTADQAVGIAQGAVSTAESAVDIADGAVITANQAALDAAAAVNTANQATSTANAASNAADAAVQTAGDALSTAQAAEDTADSAALAAQSAVTTAGTAVGIAEDAVDQADIATGIANSAKDTAEGIDAKAQEALDNSEDAVTTANAIAGTANDALDTANAAAQDATNAVSVANAAADTANGIASTANQALQTANNAELIASGAAQDAQDAVDTANGIAGTANLALTTAQAAESTADDALDLVVASADQLELVTNKVYVIEELCPALDQKFGCNGEPLDPRFTFSRPGKSWRTINGVIREYDVNEPVLTPDGWSVRPAEGNLLWPGSDFTHARWTKAGTTAESTSITSPDKTKNYGRITCAATNSVHEAHQAITLSGNTKYSKAVFGKFEGHPYIQLRAYSAAGGSTRFANFDLQNGIIGTVGVDAQAYIEPLSDGSYLCGITYTTPGTVSGSGFDVLLIPAIDSGSAPIWLATGTESVLLAGAVLNAGDPIPYIPTESSAVTRPADNLSIQGAAFADVFNPSEGTIVWDGTLASMSEYPEYFRFRNSTNSWAMFMYLSHVNGFMYVAVTNTEGPHTTLTIDKTKHWSGIPVKLGLAWTPSGEIHVHLNGTKKLTYATTLNFGALNSLFFPQVVAGRNSKNIRRLRLFTRRPGDAQMEAMTS